ncbi:MAG TPA: alpha/beta fold hydrolase [Candidatus Polarisedimenticolaceae bacterium]
MSVVRRALLVLVVALIAGAGVVFARVWQATHPARAARADQAIALDLAKAEGVTFKAADGVELRGWFLEGTAGGPAVILCHDLGGSSAQMINLAIYLQKKGLHVLAFDFRGHGASAEAAATLGATEKRDVLGALDYLVARGGGAIDLRRVGVYGTGSGAHAAVLAAADRPVLRVLVLDGLWADAGQRLAREVYGRWSFGAKRLSFVPAAMLHAIAKSAPEDARADRAVAGLRGRDVLFVAPAGDSALAAAMEKMYASLPQTRDAEANLVTLPGTGTAGLYGAELERYHDRVGTFLGTRLASTR